jgi:hypothetical protein
MNDVLAAWLRGRRVSDRAVGVSLDEALGVVATHTLTFVFADIEVSAAVVQRLGDAYAGVLAGYHQLIRVGLAAYAG